MTNTEYWLNRGSIDLENNASFRTMVDAVNCFGRTYKPNGIWTGGVKHPEEERKLIWFPKLYGNAYWNNSFDENDTIIYEKSKTDLNHFSDSMRDAYISIRILFSKESRISPYVFKGEYEIDKEKSNSTDGVAWKRIRTSVITYRTTTR
ncbi:MAG: hypothetical protein AABZ74_17135 [Cyanobacteriota bacterium]